MDTPIEAELTRIDDPDRGDDAARDRTTLGPGSSIGTVADLVGEIQADQARRWRQDDRVAVEAYLARHPELDPKGEGALDLIHGEYLLRRERGESPTLEEFEGRFPDHRPGLRDLFGLELKMGEGFETLPGRDDDDPAPRMPSIPGYQIFDELGRAGWAGSTWPGTSGSTAWWP